MTLSYDLVTQVYRHSAAFIARALSNGRFEHEYTHKKKT